MAFYLEVVLSSNNYPIHRMNPALIDKFLWVMQGFLAVAFLIAGSAKLLQSPAKVAQLVPAAIPLPFLRTLGALEILGAVGIALPLFIDAWSALTPVAAACMAIVLLAAVVIHGRAKEFSKLPMLLVLLALAMTVAVGRYFLMK
ncbi:putative membrane protein YphA (DoxX/SURF4 family) [Rhabdobacter roseus]|uniref:Putative membrane protein YphA (DoxX/SURF4 family) n=1 Tax=Rhabdobacter roseus TaxID=1655419 RepID=A0A840TY39_9BACT|nr:putative membrane protein YphA (DoxX/SURF4 family) [Rhabdobacter roseus]